jgi:hypothetical protein
VAWLGLLAVAVANSALRVATYGKTTSELATHQLSTDWSRSARDGNLIHCPHMATLIES